MRCLSLVAATVLALATAAGAKQPPSAFVANPTLRTIPLAVAAGGRTHRYTVELARTPVEQARGLMQRRTMARSHGMLFPMDPPRVASFWMEGTILPLDIVFIGADARVVNIAANTIPFSRAPIGSDGPVAAVLELGAGEAARIGLKPGDRVDYRLP